MTAEWKGCKKLIIYSIGIYSDGNEAPEGTQMEEGEHEIEKEECEKVNERKSNVPTKEHR